MGGTGKAKDALRRLLVVLDGQEARKETAAGGAGIQATTSGPTESNFIGWQNKSGWMNGRCGAGRRHAVE